MADNRDLFKRLSVLGFPMFDVGERKDVNLALADIVKSQDLRLWEGFTVVLAKAAEDGLFDLGQVGQHLKEQQHKNCLRELLLLSLALYRALNLKFSWTDKLSKSFSEEEQGRFNLFLAKLKDNADFKVAGQAMSGQRLKATFSNYFRQAQEDLSSLVSAKEELNLEYALSQVFSAKQKELFLKKLKGQKLTKTEKEYFSRTVKKKVLALANSQLHSLAQKLLG